MRQLLKTFEELVGRTVEGVYIIDDYRVLTFTDGTYAAMWSYSENGCGIPEIGEMPYMPSSKDQMRQLLAATIFTQEDADKWLADEAASSQQYEEQHEQEERDQLARLKAKYETPFAMNPATGEVHKL
jgi:hypothetical protein